MKVATVNRRGGAALVALVCLSVIALVTAGLFRVSLLRSDQVRRIERQSQADWLVEAGLERAAARLNVDSSYQGETWSIPAESLEGRTASIVIEVEELEDDDGSSRAVSVVVDFPSGGEPSGRVRRGKSFRVAPNPTRKRIDE